MIDITHDDIVALNEQVVVCRPFNHPDGTEDFWVKGSLSAILEVFIKEDAAVVTFG